MTEFKTKLTKVLTEAFRLIEAEDAAVQQGTNAVPNPSSGAPESPSIPPVAPAAEPPSQDVEKNVPIGSDGQPLSVDSMVERLNVIRGGKSFSDPEVYGQLVALFNRTPNEVKSSVDAWLTSVGRVVINAPDSRQQLPQEPTTPPQPSSTPAPEPYPGPAGPPSGGVPTPTPSST